MLILFDGMSECLQLERKLLRQFVMMNNEIRKYGFGIINDFAQLYNHDYTNWIPFGSTDFILRYFMAQYEAVIEPDFYPEWARPYIRRKIRFDDYVPQEELAFIKAPTYQKVDVATYQKPFIKDFQNRPLYFRQPVWISEIVDQKQVDCEFRMYYTNGECVNVSEYIINICNESGHWKSQHKRIKKLLSVYNIKKIVPLNFCGTIDFFLIDNDVLEIVEVQDAFSMGWYGDSSDYKTYGKFIIEGMKDLKKRVE